MSLARQHRDRIAAAHLSQQARVSGAMGGLAPQGEIVMVSTTDPVAAQIQLRLTHDLRRLKEIKSIKAKILAKVEMLPEYRAWCDGLLTAAHDAGAGVAEEVLPTIMVWCIDTGDWTRALELAATRRDFVGHPCEGQVGVPMPATDDLDGLPVEVAPALDRGCPHTGEYGRSRDLDHRLNCCVWRFGPA